MILNQFRPQTDEHATCEALVILNLQFAKAAERALHLAYTVSMELVPRAITDQPAPGSAFLRWPRKYLGPPPRAREIRFACASIFLVCLVLTALSFAFGSHGRPVFGHEPGGDFLAFYVAGEILNDYPHAQLYDLQLQQRLQHDLRPRWGQNVILVNANAPYVALLFQPLARLPYLWAYGAWLAISAALYIGGLVLIWPRGAPFDRLWVTALLISLSFFPFAFECWFGGQLSVIGFFAMALCIRCQRLERPLASGAALALCAYKPTLLLLLLPMLALGRRFRTLVGFLAGVCVLVWISLLTIGAEGMTPYIQTLKLYGRITTSNGSAQQLFKYIDLNTFVRILSGGASWDSHAVSIVVGGAAFVCLGAAWMASDRHSRVSEDFLWAATIAWTLVVNVYVPVYDGIMIVLSAILMAGGLYRTCSAPLGESDLRRFHASLIALYFFAFVTQYLASVIRLQVITLIVAMLGGMALQFWAANRRISA
jgi:hypothetical protein